MHKLSKLFLHSLLEGFFGFAWLINDNLTFPYANNPRSLVEDRNNLDWHFTKVINEIKEMKNDQKKIFR